MSDVQQEEREVPVLTEVVEETAPQQQPDGAALAALARDIERAVLARLAPEIERIVHEAVAASLAQALGEPRRD
jgi:hypothetical protein